jgi:hypothetical protein
MSPYQLDSAGYQVDADGKRVSFIRGNSDRRAGFWQKCYQTKVRVQTGVQIDDETMNKLVRCGSPTTISPAFLPTFFPCSIYKFNSQDLMKLSSSTPVAKPSGSTMTP